MSSARVVHSPDAPDNTGINAGNFSQAARVGDTVYIGGTLAIDQHAQHVVEHDAREAMRRAFTNLGAICRKAGTALTDIVMLTALLTDLDDLDALNEVQAEFFTAPFPPRSTLKVAGLPHGRVELTAVAVVGSGPLVREES
ncbi:Rid family hydrolase [Streptomyces sioyaensis]|uniref:RidA family protein n=1 Tax=Streptomyces sioyaensis TaxID=67364 RepID=UPI0033C5A973